MAGAATLIVFDNGSLLKERCSTCGCASKSDEVGLGSAPVPEGLPNVVACGADRDRRAHPWPLYPVPEFDRVFR